VGLAAYLLFFLSVLQISAADEVQLLYASPLKEDYSVATYEAGEQYVIEFSGQFFASKGLTIVPLVRLFGDFFKQVREATDKIPPNTDFVVLISSSGGGVVLADAAASTLREKCKATKCKISTYVPSGKDCTSACVPFFGKTGDVHLAGAGAKFGFHSASLMSGDLLHWSESDVLEFYKGTGLAEDWIRQRFNEGIFDKFEPTYFSAEEMRSAGLVNEIISDELYEKIKNFWGGAETPSQLFAAKAERLEYLACLTAIKI
jgi:hypothetical protein